MKQLIGLALIISLAVTSCVAADSPSEFPIALATFTENDVDVSIQLERNDEGNYFLSAEFSPPAGYYLYSKDIPLTGVDGLGRPTLLTLTPASQLKTAGGLVESVKAKEPEFEPKGLLVYPSGAVTLSLPVELPAGSDWVDETVKVTFMTCNNQGCKPPVMGKLVSIRVPGADTFK